MNKIFQPTYLSNDNYFLIVAASYIWGGGGVPLGINCLLEKFQCVINAIKFWCVDNDIINIFTRKLFPPSRQGSQYYSQ